MNDDNYFLKMIIRAVEHGIYLGEIDSPEKYMDDLVNSFVNESTLFCKYDNNIVIIEDSMCNPILNLAINKSTLFIVPAGEDNFFSCFMKVIRHVSDVHKKNKKAKNEKINEESFEWI